VKRTCLLHVSGNQYSPLPADHHTRRIWEELAKGFDEYHVLARGEDMSFSHSIVGNIHLHLLPSFGRRMWVFFFLSWFLPYFVIRYRPTHLLAQCPVLGGLAAAACALIFRLPLFVELHGAHYFGPARSGWAGLLEFHIYRSLSWFTFTVADRIRSLSDDMSDHLQKVYGSSLKRKIVTIPTRVDLKVFDTVKSDYAVGDMLRVITIGAFSPTKNHIQLMEDLHASKIPFQLTIVGAGLLAGEYKEVATKLGISEQLIITGRISHQELAALLPTQDVYVHYSVSEGLSRAILEAMATGLPVVATRVGFIGGVLENDENALVLPPPWSVQLDKAIGRIYTSENLRRQLGEAARRTIEKSFESNIVFELYRQSILAADDLSVQGL
jgi:glycosyltransferase involved in cell wall biosynthesis